MSSLRYTSLSSNHLTGMNLSRHIEETLEFLDLSYNAISGLFPNMSRFSSLKELYLGYNNLSGPIPQSCLPLPQLVVLNLMSNQFTGPLPDFLANSMLKLSYLSNNMFSGILLVALGGLSELEALNIRSNQLEGVVTEIHLMNLSRLQYLDLSLNLLLSLNFTPHWIPPFQLSYMDVSHCKLVSPVPRFLRTQKQLLYLDISYSQVSSSISSLFSSLSPMPVYLNASNNQIYGPFPNSSTSKLNDHLDLDLSRNKISGSVNFLCYYPNASFIDLTDNLLSNELPDCFEHFKILEFLNLANNNFSGSIPNSFGFLESLIWLHLGNNSFTGVLPESMRNCRALSIMDLQGNALMGDIPTWLGDSLSRLVVLILRSNALYGNIPSNLCSLHRIQVLDLSSNNIAGEIPKCLHNLTDLTDETGRKGYYVFEYQSTFKGKDDSATLIWKGQESKYGNTLYLVKLIDLSCNNLVGEIPPEITTLTGLVGLNLSRNNLIGPIPQNIGMLRSLNFLDFSRNHLSGGIPTSVSELSSLGILDLSFNNFSGRIPQNDHSLTIDESAYIGNVGLCGPPLNKSCIPIPSFTGEANLQHEDENDDFITDGFYIFLGIGFLVGLWGILGTIFINQYFRYAFLGW